MIAPGTRLGPYVVSASIGSGGMGVVYRARDARLGRDVAIKVLPPEVSGDPERLQRFEQEARAAAALNHPNILAVHDVGQHDASPYIVSELLEGETLRERLNGGALPVRKAVEYAVQIAHGLAAANEKGITHRDLKPENLFVTIDGRVKVLDFGLAKLTEAAHALAGVSQLPTLSPPTTPGMVLGTVGYMAPEQVRGETADHRADIFALGAILYEMLAGRRAFHAGTTAETMTAILKEDPPGLAAERHIPPALVRIVDRCLEKSPAGRFQSTRDLAFTLEGLSGQAGAIEAVSAAEPRMNRERLAWLVAGVLLLVGVVSLPFAVVHVREPARDDRPIRFDMLAPEKAAVTGTPPAVCPDGRRVVFVAQLDGQTQLWIRPIDSTVAQPLPGTDAADYPFWSPDSRFIGFFAGGRLRKIDASGGPAQALADAPAPRGGTWNRDGVIVFAPSNVGPLLRVSSSGGAATPLMAVDTSRGELNHRYPSFLSDGRHFLFFVAGGEDKQGIYLGSLETMDRKLLLRGNSSGTYAPPGYVLFVREQTLMAQRFDAQNLELAGEAFPVADAVGFYQNNGGTFSASDNGVLAYARGDTGSRQLAWFDRSGKLTERIGSAMSLFDVALSPDEKRAAIQSGANDLWVVDLARAGVSSRLTFSAAVEDLPVWAPDGSRVLFNSTAGGAPDIYWKASTGAGSDELVLKSATSKRPTDWSRDGRFILYENDDPTSRTDLWVLPLFGDKKPELFLQTPFNEQHARFSPDGKWIAYVSDESGTPEVYVQSYPPSGGKWLVSTRGGFAPRWRRDGKELFYLALDRRIMSVEVRAAGATFEVSAAKALFAAPVDVASANATNRYDVSADGQRFLVNAPVEDARSAPITVVVNWDAGLEQ